MEIAALHKWSPVHTASDGFFSYGLLLMLLKVCTRINLFHTCSILEEFLVVLFSLVPNQVENLSQDWRTHLTGVGLLGRPRFLRSPGLWHIYRNALFKGCLHSLCSTGATWTQRNTCDVHFIGREQSNYKYTNEKQKWADNYSNVKVDLKVKNYPTKKNSTKW